MRAKLTMGNAFRNIATRFLMLVTVIIANGQPPRGSIIASPQVNPDKTAVFRYLAPLASEVKLSGQF